MPKSTRSKPFKNLGPLKITTFIKYLRQHLVLEIPSIITQTASTATKNLGGQKQLINSPTANDTPIKPLLKQNRLRISYPPYSNIISGKIKNVTDFVFYWFPKALNLSILQKFQYMTCDELAQFYRHL